MLYKLDPVEEFTFTLPQWITNLGGYNHLPQPFEPSSLMAPFWEVLRSCNPSHIDHRQVVDWPTAARGVTPVVIYWFFDRAFAIRIGYDIPEPELLLIGCRHQYESVPVGACLHNYTCRRCKFSYNQDSSG